MNLDLYNLPEDVPNSWIIATGGAVVSWSNRKERIEVIRAGIPFEHAPDHLQQAKS